MALAALAYNLHCETCGNDEFFSRRFEMFRAELVWLANGPTLKMHGKLVGDWAKQAKDLLTVDVVPRGLIVDLTEVTYIDSSGEHLLTWLGSLGAVFVASGVNAIRVFERLGLSVMRSKPARRRHCSQEQRLQSNPMHADSGRQGARKEAQ